LSVTQGLARPSKLATPTVGLSACVLLGILSRVYSKLDPLSSPTSRALPLAADSSADVALAEPLVEQQGPHSSASTEEANNFQHVAETPFSNFVLTTEWQEVPEGVRLSAPVHVRLHRRTGKKLAKLVDLESLDDLPDAHCFVVSP
jgi:hypothetical protein